MERMNALDAGFYFAEDRTSPLHLATVTLLEGPAPAQRDLDRLVLERLAGMPRYRRRVRTVPFNLGRPLWVDDPAFELGYHVRRTAVPHPGGPAELRDLLGRVLGRGLDLSRPPWELWVIEGLDGGGWAMAAKVHHCVPGGGGGADLVAALAGPAAAPPPAESIMWRAEVQPSAVSMIVRALYEGLGTPAWRLVRLPYHVCRNVGGLRVPILPRRPAVPAPQALPPRPPLPAPPARTAPPARSGTGLREAWDHTTGLPRLAENLAYHGVTSLNAPIGRHRRWSWTDAELESVRTVRRRFGGTVDDVLLAAVTRGFRELLAGRGELTEQAVIRTLVPLAVRAEYRAGGETDRISGVVVELPCGEADPLRRLMLLREQTAELRRTHQEIGVGALIRLAGFAPPALSLVSRATRTAIRPFFQTIVATVPAPRSPLRVMGRRVLSFYPYVPIAAGAGVSVGVSSYLGGLHFGVTGDFDVVPDLEVLTMGITAGLDELLRLAQAA